MHPLRLLNRDSTLKWDESDEPRLPLIERHLSQVGVDLLSRFASELLALSAMHRTGTEGQ
jgi:hypothetical protein